MRTPIKKPPIVGQTYPYEIKYGQVTITEVGDRDPVTGLFPVKFTRDGVFDPESGEVYGSPPGPPG